MFQESTKRAENATDLSKLSMKKILINLKSLIKVCLLIYSHNFSRIPNLQEDLTSRGKTKGT